MAAKSPEMGSLSLSLSEKVGTIHVLKDGVNQGGWDFISIQGKIHFKEVSKHYICALSEQKVFTYSVFQNMAYM